MHPYALVVVTRKQQWSYTLNKSAICTHLKFDNFPSFPVDVCLLCATSSKPLNRNDYSIASYPRTQECERVRVKPRSMDPGR